MKLRAELRPVRCGEAFLPVGLAPAPEYSGRFFQGGMHGIR